MNYGRYNSHERNECLIIVLEAIRIDTTLKND